MLNTIKQKYSHRGFFFMRQFITSNLSQTGKLSIEERSVELAHYIIDSKDTVRGTAKKFGISKSTVHTEVTFQNGINKSLIIPESIEIKKVFLAKKNPVVKLGLVIK